MSGKKVKWVIISFVWVFFLTGCKVSKEYQGEWFTIDITGTQEKMKIDEKSVLLGDISYDLSQHGAGFQNSTKYYQIKMNDQNLTVVFPDKKDLDNALILKPNDQDKPLVGNVLMKMNRTNYPSN